MGSPSNALIMEAVLLRLKDALAELADLTCAQIYAELDSYVDIAPDALTAAVGRNLRTALIAVRDGRVPEPASLDGAAQTAQERFASGVPAEEIVRGFRISIALIHERFLDVAVSEGLPVEEMVEGSRIMWGVGDAFTTRIITEYHDLALDAALRDARRRAAAVRGLLAGQAPDDATPTRLNPQALYAAVHALVPAGADVEAVRAALEASGSTADAPATVVAEGSACLGLVARTPQDPGVAAGLGPFVRPDELPRSDRVARQALQLAHRLGRTGVQDITALGWRMAAASRPDVWRDYAERFLTPLEAEGEFGRELRLAVLAWLRHQQSINRAAAAINVHANTLRYRLRRFADITGADLDDLDDTIGIAWALELEHPGHDTL